MDLLNNLQSESIKAVTTALINAQKEIGAARKDTNGNRYKYATIEQILALIKMPLLKNGLILTQTTLPINGQTTIITQVTHGESGEFIRGFLPVETPEAIQSRNGNATTNNAQRLGSGITYARRYALVSLLAIPQEDDDGMGYQAQAVQEELNKQAQEEYRDRAMEAFNNALNETTTIDGCEELRGKLQGFKPNLDHERYMACWEALKQLQAEIARGDFNPHS